MSDVLQSGAPALLAGLLLGGGLIIAIGAQNAYVLRLGLIRKHVFPVCLLCAAADALLITMGVFGLGALVQSSPLLLALARWGGATFLLVYSFIAFRRALRPQSLQAEGQQGGSLKLALATAFGFTFLNPHVYLDTVVLIGSISAQYDDPARFAFGAGAVASSFLWFFSLGYGARLLAPLFARPRAWQILDLLIGLVMLALAVSLILPLLGP